MAAHMSFICDAEDCKNEHGHKVYVPVIFDKLKETWQDVIDFIRAAGWHVELEDEPNDGRVTKSFCPKHKFRKD